MKYFLTIFIFLFVSSLWADIINVPSDQITITAAISVAAEGDTVLVAPGTYKDSITVNGKNLTLASQYIMEGDTSFISKTIIDGNNQWRPIDVLTVDSTTTICGFTVINGHGGNGGAIRLINSFPVIHNLMIKNCIADSSGGGIYCGSGFLQLKDMRVENNQAAEYGGAIFTGASAELTNISILSNQALKDGGGIAFINPYNTITATLSKSEIIGNSALNGGGIYTHFVNKTYLSIHRTVIEKNNADRNGGGMLLYDIKSASLDSILVQYNESMGDGGGIDLYHSDGDSIELSGTTIRYNKAEGRGGGLRSYLQPQFSEYYLNNIYMNEAAEGSDMWFLTNRPGFTIDTCSVVKPTSYHIACREWDDLITIKVNTGVIEQIENDIFVSPNGNNSNNGLSPDAPLASISNALFKIYVDSANPRTIYLADGTYEPSDIEFFPLNLPSYITLKGSSKEKTIIDGLNSFTIIVTNGAPHIWNKITDLKIQNGNERYLALIYVRSINMTGDSVFIKNVEISNCYATDHLLNTQSCYLDIDSTDLINNHANSILFCSDNKLSLKNSRITGNILDNGRGILDLSSCKNVLIERSIIAGNSGTLNNLFINIIPIYSTNLTIINSLLGYNTYIESTDLGAEIYSKDKKLQTQIVNSIIWNTGNNKAIYTAGNNDTILIAYSDIKHGQDNINMKGEIVWSEGNISDYPQFKDTLSADFSLLNDSPCVNKGTDFFVWKHDTLVNLSSNDYYGYAPDMGAIENTDPADIYEPDTKPFTYKLDQNYPNPFNPITKIKYSIKKQGKVKIKIFNVLGELIKILIDKEQVAGKYTIPWNASTFSSGIYFYQIECNNFKSVKKMVLLK